MKWISGVLVTLSAAWAPTAHAGPMGFKDSTMAMGDFGPGWQEAWINHAVTARDDDPLIVKAFDMGANDFVAKPFSFPVLAARTRAQIEAVKGA